MAKYDLYVDGLCVFSTDRIAEIRTAFLEELRFDMPVLCKQSKLLTIKETCDELKWDFDKLKILDDRYMELNALIKVFTDAQI